MTPIGEADVGLLKGQLGPKQPRPFIRTYLCGDAGRPRMPRAGVSKKIVHPGLFRFSPVLVRFDVIEGADRLTPDGHKALGLNPNNGISCEILKFGQQCDVAVLEPWSDDGIEQLKLHILPNR